MRVEFMLSAIGTRRQQIFNRQIGFDILAALIPQRNDIVEQTLVARTSQHRPQHLLLTPTAVSRNCYHGTRIPERFATCHVIVADRQHVVADFI